MEVKILLGPICSGKSQYSKHLQQKHGYIRFSIDELKRMAFGKISNDQEHDEYIAYMVYNSILAWSGPKHKGDRIVVDGFPLCLRHLGYILQSFNCRVLTFDADIATANIRNLKRRRDTGIFIDPKEIKRYYHDYKTFIRSEPFHSLIQKTGAKLINMNKLDVAL